MSKRILSSYAVTAVAASLLCALVSAAQSPPSGPGDLVSPPSPQYERPGSSGPGQGELEMEKEFGLAGIDIPWGGDGEVPASTAVAVRDGKCVFRYRYAVRNVDRKPSLATFNRIRLGDARGAVLHNVPVPSIAAGGRTVSSGEIALAPGRSVLYVKLDATDRMIERDERDNLRRVGVTVNGLCGHARLKR